MITLATIAFSLLFWGLFYRQGRGLGITRLVAVWRTLLDCSIAMGICLAVFGLAWLMATCIEYLP